jgi:hypothetical protein
MCGFEQAQEGEAGYRPICLTDWWGHVWPVHGLAPERSMEEEVTQ